jgi:antitoxin StbD
MLFWICLNSYQDRIMLLDRADQAISSTDLQKGTRELLDRMADGRQDRYVVIRDNRPTAVMFSVERYEALMAELEDLRIEALARERLATLNDAAPLTHAEMLERFATHK